MEVRRVLILDNDQYILEVMKEALTYEGYEVHALLHTENIFSQLDEHKPDVLILDYLLNGINGGEICHQIKKNPSTAQLPVIIISAYPRVLKSLGPYGCDAFIAKPFNLKDITALLHQLTQQSTVLND